MNATLSLESRRAMFRAAVIAMEAEEQEVSSESIAAALLVSPDVVTACERIGLSAPGVLRALELADAADHLRNAESSLAERGLSFGAREHIDSVKTRPLSLEARQIVHDLDLACAQRAITSLDLFEAFLSSVPDLRARALRHGLTLEALRDKLSPTRRS